MMYGMRRTTIYLPDEVQSTRALRPGEPRYRSGTRLGGDRSKDPDPRRQAVSAAAPYRVPDTNCQTLVIYHADPGTPSAQALTLLATTAAGEREPVRSLTTDSSAVSVQALCVIKALRQAASAASR
jgi:hypothetical protein